MDSEQLNASVNDLALAIGLLVRRLRAASASHDLSWTERAVLARLGREGPATVSELARAESVKPQSMGATIAALEELGLVERQPHPTDGRQVRILLTEAGAALCEQTRTAKRTWLAEAIAQLPDAEQRTLFAAGEILKRLGEA
jgi:DNA-binding MarR family transcriptional regulator